MCWCVHCFEVGQHPDPQLNEHQPDLLFHLLLILDKNVSSRSSKWAYSLFSSCQMLCSSCPDFIARYMLTLWHKMPASPANLKPHQSWRFGSSETFKWAPVHHCAFQFVFSLPYFISLFPSELPALLILGLAPSAEARAIHILNNQFRQLPEVKSLR